MHILKTKNIVLASSAPRRQELLNRIGLKVKACPPTFEEDLDPKNFDSMDDYVMETALQKVLEVDRRLNESGEPADIIIGADTMVTLGDEMFGKPTSQREAFEMLSKLAGKRHTVLTGVVVMFQSKVSKFCERTDVFFDDLTSEQIQGYVATGEPMNKAGGYGIQGIGGTLVKRIDGDYFSVTGLPLHRLSETLCDLIPNVSEN